MVHLYQQHNTNQNVVIYVATFDLCASLFATFVTTFVLCAWAYAHHYLNTTDIDSRNDKILHKIYIMSITFKL